MSPLQLKIKQLEAKVIADRELLHLQTNILTSKIIEHKNNILTWELLFGGFAFGYLIGPKKIGHDKTMSPQVATTTKVLTWAKEFTKLLLKFSALTKFNVASILTIL